MKAEIRKFDSENVQEMESLHQMQLLNLRSTVPPSK